MQLKNIKDKKIAHEWVEQSWEDGECYNFDMTKTRKSLAPIWAQELINDVKEIKTRLTNVENEIVAIKVRLDHIEDFIVEQKAFNKRIEKDFQDIKNCPTIKKELALM